MELLTLALGMGIANMIAEDEKKKRERNTIEIPDNATNGDIIKALFPNTDIYISPYRDRVDICTKKEHLYVDKDWWNAPYKAESEG